MAERLEQVRRAVRGPRAELVAGSLLVLAMTAALVTIVVRWVPDTDVSIAWPAMTVYLMGCLAVGLVAAMLVARVRHAVVTDIRDYARARHWTLVVFWLPLGLLFPVGSAPAFAAGWTCEQGDGVLVVAELTDTRPASGTMSGTYTYEGQTYDLVVSSDEYLDRQVGPAQPPDADHASYLRSYRVPWAGSPAVCGTAEQSDRNDLVAMGALGVVGSLVAAGAARELVGRRRRTDESGDRRRSAPA